MSSSFRTICRPHTVFSFVCSRRNQSLYSNGVRVSFRCQNSYHKLPSTSPSLFSPWLHNTHEPWFRVNQKRTAVRASNWADSQSPYETLELERDADEDQIKVAYRRLAKYYHPDVYDGRGKLEEGETAEARFIKIQAAYELLMDEEKKRQYDRDHRVNPMRASQAWMEWLIKKTKGF